MQKDIHPRCVSQRPEKQNLRLANVYFVGVTELESDLIQIFRVWELR